MARAGVRDVVAVLACPLLVAGAVALDPAASWPEWAFGTVLLCGLLLLARSAGGAAARSWHEQRRARAIAAVSPGAAARQAVVDERARLGRDVERAVCASVVRMAVLADDAAQRWDTDPSPALRAVGDEGREAVTELRRMVGLLRDAGPATPPTATATVATELATDQATDQPAAAVPAAGRRRLRAALVLGLLTAVLATAELLSYATQAQPTVSVATTVLAAALTGLALVRPVAAALAVSAVAGLGWAAGLPVGPGLWMLVGLGTAAWAAARSGRVLVGAGSLAVLGTVTVLAQRALDPTNAPFVALVVVSGAAGGWAVRVGERTARAAHGRATAHEEEVAETVRAAVRADALAVARELHDLVSSAVGVMVVHAGAAEALRDRSPEQALAALRTVRTTAAETVQELGGLTAAVDRGAFGTVPLPATAAGQPDTGPAHRAEDLGPLVERMRGAGLDVHIDVHGEVPATAVPTVFRVVQEALTNAVRHAPGSRVLVTVRGDDDGVDVAVVDDGGGGAAPPSPRGYGLVGLAERAASFGGTLQAGPRPDAPGFRVEVRLPLAALSVGRP